MGQKGKRKKVCWGLLERGDSIRTVSEILGIPPTTISIDKKRIEERGSVEYIRRSSRPPKVSDRHYRRLEF